MKNTGAVKAMSERKAKIGLNRGKARLWLEGQWLADAGFPVGAKFTARIEPEQITLSQSAIAGDRTVSGKGAKPIIDINTDALRAVAPAGEYIRVFVYRNIIIGRKG